ncbi:MAG: hypothetical protein CMJ49_07485 [Planctomycetaceae bacterium]|nr:hypothetical protein [Planctomycetaceae bacterium]
MFDFEEQKLGNYERMPMHWHRIHRAGYPVFTEVGFDTDQHLSGNHALKLQLNGGSAGAVLQPGVLAVVPMADYLVTARVRTAKVTHTRARLIAFFVDQKGEPLADGRVVSDLLQANDQWTTVQLALPDCGDRAAWLILQLELLQPERYREQLIQQHEWHHEDIDAAAWFDDIVVYQLPRMALNINSPLGILRAPDQPTLEATVRDLTGQALTADLVVYDESGRPVDRMHRRIDGRLPATWQWTPNLPRFGWYWADLQVNSDLGAVGRVQAIFSALPNASQPPHPEAQRFMIIAEQLPAPQQPHLPALLDHLRSRAVQLAIWAPDQSIQDLDRLRRDGDPLVQHLLSAGHDVTMALTEPPRELAYVAGVPGGHLFDLMAADPNIWQPYLESILARHGEHVQRWQVGRSATAAAYHTVAAFPPYQQLIERLNQYVFQPTIVMPVSALYDTAAPARDAAALTLILPTSIRPDQIDTYAGTYPTPQTDVTVLLQTLSPADYRHTDRAADLVRRMVHVWRAQPSRVAIAQPWRPQSANTPERIAPDPLLAVWANAAHQLAGRRVVGQLPLGQGIRCYVLQSTTPNTGALVAWTHGAEPPDATRSLWLGDDPVAVDIWGNRTPLPLRDDRHQLNLTQQPVFIDGINVQLAMLRAGFTLSPQQAESSFNVHQHTLTITNPWPRTISGRVKMAAPENWRITPRFVPFSIPAGQSVKVPVELTFPISEIAGRKLIHATIDVEADRNYQIQLAAPLHIGLKNVRVRAAASIESKQPGAVGDVVIRQTVTNTGDKPLAFTAFALAPGQPRAERIIAELLPGQSTVKTFRFAGAAHQLKGRTVRVGLREIDGPAVLNERVEIQ